MKTRKVRILSLDGGGIRGVIPAKIITYIEEKLIVFTKNPNVRISDYFDFISGTSTGGILSCFYLIENDTNSAHSTKYSAQEALDFYAKEGYGIFNQSKKNKWKRLFGLLDGAAYREKQLEKIFYNTFKDIKMSELTKHCIVTTYNLNNKQSFFFNSRDRKIAERSFYVRDVVRSTAAAPTFFKHARIPNLAKNNELMYNIDGGVFANNPAMCAYAECRKTKFDFLNELPMAKDMMMLSIGTGGGGFSLPKNWDKRTWNLLHWATKTPEIMIDGGVDTVDYQMKLLFETVQEDYTPYLRLNIKNKNQQGRKRFDSNMANSDKKNIQQLEDAAMEIIENQKAQIDNFIQQLIDAG